MWLDGDAVFLPLRNRASKLLNSADSSIEWTDSGSRLDFSGSRGVPVARLWMIYWIIAGNDPMLKTSPALGVWTQGYRLPSRCRQ